ncbi:MAG: PorV/PorQ family protein [candidate division Zixibacteria bacterium]|nr:PorV/PorQ family protein [candidate division Zixibacteria bacterium]
MKRSLFRILVIWGFVLFLSALLGRTTIASDNGRASADFLNIGISARSAALGGAFTSIADDASASYWNPGGLTALECAQISFSHFTWYQGLNFNFLGAAFPVSDRLTLAVNTEYLSYGEIEGYDADDNPIGDIGSTYDLAAGVAGGYRLTDNLSVGVGLKYIIVSLANVKATALAADLGLRFQTGKFLFGLASSNIGQSLTFYDAGNKLPANIRAGLGYRPFGSSFLVSAEVENQFYGNLAIKNGFEFNYHQRYFIRTGYSFFPSQDGRNLGQSMTFGVGALLGAAQFDYSFSPKENFSAENIHRISISLRMGN